MKIRHDVLLRDHTSFRIGGKARFFVEANKVEDLRKVFAAAAEENLPYLILGEGSNVLISDEGFPGYVIRPMIRGIDMEEDGTLVAGAAEHWDDVVDFSVTSGFSGLENLSWIPGSVGAAPVQNIGAYGAELKDVLIWVEAFDPTDGVVKKLTAEECRFGYRDSLFKTPAGKKLVILRVAMKLKLDGKPNISYKDLAKYFEGHKSPPTLSEVREAVIKIRQNKLPDIRKVGTAGSFFKNPIISEAKYAELSAKFPGLPSFPADEDNKKIPLAWILDKVCGLNGFREGEVGLFETQPLALVNFGKATASDVLNFANKIFEIVKEKTGIEIEWEVNKI